MQVIYEFIEFYFIFHRLSYIYKSSDGGQRSRMAKQKNTSMDTCVKIVTKLCGG